MSMVLLLPKDFENWNNFKTFGLKKQLKLLKEDEICYRRVKQLLGRYIVQTGLHYVGHRDDFINKKMKEMMNKGEVNLQYSLNNFKRLTLNDLLK